MLLAERLAVLFVGAAGRKAAVGAGAPEVDGEVCRAARKKWAGGDEPPWLYAAR